MYNAAADILSSGVRAARGCSVSESSNGMKRYRPVPFTVSRHRHPKTRTPDGQARTEPAPTGIDYLSALGDGHDEALREQVSYRFLVSGPREEPEKREEKDEEEGDGRD